MHPDNENGKSQGLRSWGDTLKYPQAGKAWFYFIRFITVLSISSI
jgi:hypothetical protein